MATVSHQCPAAPAAAGAGPAAGLRLSEHLPEDVSERLPELMRDVIDEIGGPR
jgi:hypothetical protein